MNTKEAILKESEECAASAQNMSNTPEDREIFWVVSIILKGIADKITE